MSDNNTTISNNVSANNSSTSTISDLLEELQSTKSLPSAKKNIQQANPDVTDDTINNFIMSRASSLIDKGMATLEEIKDSVESAGDPEEIDAYAKLVTAIAGSIEALNKINIQNKRDKNAKEIKKMDIDAKKELAEQQQKNLPSHNTNILIASREEIMDKLLETIQNNQPTPSTPEDTLDEIETTTDQLDEN